MKSALIAREAGVNPKSMRYVAFEGGGEAITALMGGHVHAYSGDASEVQGHLKGGRIKVLAILAPERLKGELAEIPTAIEQGYNVEWTITRGFYMGPKVSDADYQWWVAAFEKLQGSPEFDQLRAERGLFPFNLTGEKLTENVRKEVARYKVLATELGLVAQ
jgi:putative tricarboxylic transport membrane protein